MTDFSKLLYLPLDIPCPPNVTHVFDTADDSTNIWWLGYFMRGEGWHNNHHNQPNNSGFGEKWWEFDAGAWFIKIINKLNKQ